MRFIKRLSFGLTILLNLFVMGNVATATEATTGSPRLNSIDGTIEAINTHQNSLIVNDRNYSIAQDLQVITPGGHNGRLALLFPGKRIRMLVEFSAGASNARVIHKIYILK